MVSRSRNTILLPLAFAASVMCGSARADVCMMPGQAFECVGAACDVEAGVQNGQQHEVVEASQRLRVRAIDSNLSTEQSYAELFGVVVSPAADMFVRANMNVRFSGFLTGFGGGVVNFGSISIRAIVRDLDSNTIVASTEIAQHTNQGEFGMGGPEFFENFFGPPAHRDVPFDSDEGVRLEAGRQYGIGISARAEARGGIINNGVSNYFTGGNGVFLNSLKLISWADTTVAGFEDSDGDGLPNIWETDGVTDCDGTVLLDLPGFGAQPNHKDLFVELDWMASRPPNARAIQTVKDAFNQAPVNAGGQNNPDTQPGVSIWIDTGALTDDTGALVGDNLGGGNEIPAADIPDPTGEFIPPLSEGVGGLDYVVDIDGNGLTDFYEVKAKNFDLIRTRIFRYSIQAKDRTDVGNTYPGGQGELGGDDTVGYSRLPIVLMHEVGHNLSLDHGGNEGLNCKPNHVSIMNYALVPFGIARRSTDSQAQDTNNDGVIDARILDFSPPRFPGGRGFAPLYGPGDGLDEMALSETRVLDPSDTANSTRFFDQNGDGRDLNLDEQPDWNGGGNAPGTVQADVNSAPDFAGCDSPPEADLSTLLGHDDWSAITLPISINGIVQDLPENDNGVTPVPQEDDPNESDMFENEAKFSTLDLSVTKTVDAELVMAGQPLTYEITVTNQGPNSALEVFIEDELDENVTPVDLPGNCSVVEDGRVSCDLDVIAEGESSTVTLQVMVSPRLPCGQADTVPLVNTVTVRNGEWSDVNPADNTATAESEALCLRYEYAAKFLCGTPDGRVPLLTAPGDYATIVNVHNFQSRDVPFFKKLALAFPPRAQEAGEIHPIGIDELAYDEALKADCDDLRDRLFDGAFPNGFIEGYLVVQSPRRLDVDVVYTAAAEGEVKTIDVERVPERDLRADLAITKTSVVYPIPLLGPDVLSQFGLYAVLYTVEIHNGGSVHAEDVEVADHVALNTGPGTVGVVVVPDVPFEIPEGSALGDIVNTPFPPASDFTLTIPEIAPGDTARTRFWALVLTYTSSQSAPGTSGAELTNRAEVTGQGPETTLINNTVQTVDELEN